MTAAERTIQEARAIVAASSVLARAGLRDLKS